MQENGCFSTQTCQNVQVYDKPIARIDPVPDVCFNGGNNSVNFSYSGTAGVATYSWDFGASAVPATSNLANPTNVHYLTTGTKTATLTVATNGCISDPVVANFDVIQEPKADFIINTNGITCAFDSIDLSITNPPVGPGQTYLWNFGTDANPATSSLTDPGKVIYTSGGTKTISLIVTYRGCQDVYASQVVVEETPQFSAGPDQEYCEGTGGTQINATTTGGNPAYTWSWTCNATSGCGLSSNTVEDPFANPQQYSDHCS